MPNGGDYTKKLYRLRREASLFDRIIFVPNSIDRTAALISCEYLRIRLRWETEILISMAHSKRANRLGLS